MVSVRRQRRQMAQCLSAQETQRDLLGKNILIVKDLMTESSTECFHLKRLELSNSDSPFSHRLCLSTSQGGKPVASSLLMISPSHVAAAFRHQLILPETLITEIVNETIRVQAATLGKKCWRPAHCYSSFSLHFVNTRAGQFVELRYNNKSYVIKSFSFETM